MVLSLCMQFCIMMLLKELASAYHARCSWAGTLWTSRVSSKEGGAGEASPPNSSTSPPKPLHYNYTIQLLPLKLYTISHIMQKCEMYASPSLPAHCSTSPSSKLEIPKWNPDSWCPVIGSGSVCSFHCLEIDWCTHDTSINFYLWSKLCPPPFWLAMIIITSFL